MSNASFNYQDARAVITATNLNQPFTALKDASDGTSGKIDPSNTRSEAFNRNHFKQSVGPNVSDSDFDSNETVYGFNPAQTEVFTTIATFPVNLALQPNDCLRLGSNPLVTTTSVNTLATPLIRSESAFYLCWFLTIGGVDVQIGYPFGYNTIVAGDGNTGSSDNKTLFYERLPMSYCYLPSIATTVTEIKVKIYFDDATHYRVDLKNLYLHYVWAKF